MATPDVLAARADVLRSEAAAAWRALGHGAVAPDRVEILKGPRRRKVVCRLVGVGPAASDVIGKWCRRAKGRIERTIYHDVLPRVPVPAPRCYGLVEAGDEFCWLFVEDVGGAPYSAADAEHRRLAGEWLGRLHTAAARLEGVPGLPELGTDHYLRALRAARAAILTNLDNPALTAPDRAVLDAIRARLDAVEVNWHDVEATCALLPRTILHGDFVAKNLRVRRAWSRGALVAFDWSCAGRGPAAVDLARSPSARFCANPELAAYAGAARDHWPGVDAEALARCASVGGLLRSILSVRWEGLSLGADSVAVSISRMRFYRAEIVRALRAAGVAP